MIRERCGHRAEQEVATSGSAHFHSVVIPRGSKFTNAESIGAGGGGGTGTVHEEKLDIEAGEGKGQRRNGEETR